MNIHKILLDNSSDPIFAFAPGGQYLYVNNAFANGVGKNIDQIIGNKIWEVFPHDEAEKRYNVVKHVFATGEETILDVRVPRPDGDRYYITTASPVKDEQGNITTVICSSKEITDRKKAEKELTDERKNLKIIINNIPGVVSKVDTNYRYQFSSDGYTRIFGYPSEQMVGQTMTEVLGEEEFEKIRPQVEMALSGQEVTFERMMKTVDASTHTSLVRFIPDFDTEGKVTGFYIVGVNISERKLIEQALKESEERYRTLAENSTDVIWVLDIESETFRYISPSVTQLRGLTVEEAMSQTISETCPPEIYNYVKKLTFERLEVFQKGIEEIYIDELQQYHKNGQLVWIEITTKFIPNPKTGKIELLGSSRNISSRKAIEANLLQSFEELEASHKEIATLNEEYQSINEELRTINEELVTAKSKAEESDLLKSAFLANLSHEIRTPMNGIIGFSDLLSEEDLSDEEKNMYIGVIQSSGHRLLSIINDIIEISRLDSKQVKVNNESFNVVEILNHLYDELSISIPKDKNLILIKNEFNTGNNSQIKTDKVKLQQIITNLISNAIKYTLEGNVQYGCTITPEGNFELYVKDTGIGIAPKYHEAIFERFRQVYGKDAVFQSGSGLGLAISKSYVDLLGGKIWLESTPGKGSTFYISIPVEVLHQESKVEIAKTKMVSETSFKEKVLVAEDEDVNFLYLSQLLKKHNFDVFWAKNGKEALSILEKEKNIAMIFMDLKMPLMDGFETLKAIRELKYTIPVIAQTAYALAGDKERTLAAGFDWYIAKPIHISQLTEAISRIRMITTN